MNLVLGQQTAQRAMISPSTARSVAISRQEAEMVVRVVESIVAFWKSFPLEFYSYCPMKRWKPVLERVGGGVQEIEVQLASKNEVIMVSADTLFAAVDLEECASGARDARLSSAKTALIISAAGAIGETLLGFSWLGLPAYIISLAIVLGKPLVEMSKEFPAEPFRVGSLSGPPRRHWLGDHTDKTKILDRIIVSRDDGVERYHWGTVRPGNSSIRGAVCLYKGRRRVRIEGWMDDKVQVNRDWKRVPISMCLGARNEIAVWSPCWETPKDTGFPLVPMDSGFDETFWVEYTGPLTGGVCRKAGPFG